MMQYVATTKSDVAAFATGAETKSFAGNESQEQFGKVLQDQKSNYSVVVKYENTPPQTSSQKALQAPTDEVKNATSSAINEDTTPQNKSTSSQPIKTADAATSTSSKDKAETAGNDGHASEVESAVNNLNEELKVGNTKAELQLVLPSKQDDVGSELAVDSANIVAEEWVTLIDNLKRLADNAQTSKRSLAEIEGHSVDVSTADLPLPNKIEKDLLEQMLDKQTAAKQQAEQSISVLVGKALGEVLAIAETEGLTDAEVQLKTAELLLEQPQVFQNLLTQLNILSQKSDIDTAARKTFGTIDKFIAKESLLVSQQVQKDTQADLTLDNVVKKDSLLASQKVAVSGSTDLTLAENKALLKTLLVDSETDKTQTQEPVKLAKLVVPNETEKSLQAQQIDSPITTLESVAEQDVQQVQVAPSNILNSSKPEKVSSNIDIKNILNLTANKLDKVLENIAQRVFESKNVAEPISSEQIAPQLVMPKVAEIVSSKESSSKEFVAALKSGLEEFKNQLSQGREPGMDLKALVADALAKTTDTTKAPINLDQIINSVSQVLDFAQTMNRAIERQDQTYSAILRDVAQIQGEQSKQTQLNQFESKFEKAINIAKPEGHQQLAEKVRWMVNTKNLMAEIRLDPAELGSVHVKVAISGESATVNFLVQSPQARDAVDNATPRLREMLAEKGIELGQSSVRQESDGQQGQGDGELAKQGCSSNGEAEDIEVPEQVLAQQKIVNGALGGIDYFV